MFRRIPLYGWVAIVVCLVAIVYIQWPALTARTMYEGYEDAAPAAVSGGTQAQLNAGSVALPAAAVSAVAPAADTNAKLDAVIEALNRLADAKKPVATGGKSVPMDADSTKSQPADALYQPDSKAALQQGASFSAGCPKPRPDADAVPVVPATCTRPAPARPCPRCPYCKQYSPCGCRRKPDSSPNPVCPDLRDYVRKDSIPCWGCKLK